MSCQRRSLPRSSTLPLYALAHPPRWLLIEALTIESPATATRCAELTGESQATCSFHLRQLARYGFVEEAPSESKRERPWRLVATTRSWSGRQPDPVRARAATELSQCSSRAKLIGCAPG